MHWKHFGLLPGSSYLFWLEKHIRDLQFLQENRPQGNNVLELQKIENTCSGECSEAKKSLEIKLTRPKTLLMTLQAQL
jgi:hypothetical protein